MSDPVHDFSKWPSIGALHSDLLTGATERPFCIRFRHAMVHIGENNWGLVAKGLLIAIQFEREKECWEIDE